MPAPALPTANVATGMPLGICTMASSASRPSRWPDGMGTPRTGRVVFAATTPGRCAAPPAPAMNTSTPRAAAVGDVLEERVGRAVRAQDADLVRERRARSARRAPAASRRGRSCCPSGSKRAGGHAPKARFYAQLRSLVSLERCVLEMRSRSAPSLGVDHDVPAVLERAEEELVAERLLDLFLDDARERARAVVRVVALLGEVLASRASVSSIVTLALGELLAELADELVDDARHDARVERRRRRSSRRAGCGTRG